MSSAIMSWPPPGTARRFLHGDSSAAAWEQRSADPHADRNRRSTEAPEAPVTSTSEKMPIAPSAAWRYEAIRINDSLFMSSGARGA